MQLQQLQSVVSLAAAYHDSAHKIIKPNPRVLLPVKHGDAFANFDSLWQRHGMNVCAETLRATELLIIITEGFLFPFVAEPTCFVLCTSCVNPVLS
jgi:hypothetical protein